MAKHIKQKWYSFQTHAHSDNLVHWTGKDIMLKHARLSLNDLASSEINPNELWQDLKDQRFIDPDGRKLQRVFQLNEPSDIGLTLIKNNVAFKALKSVHLYANEKHYVKEVVDEFLQRLKNILLYGLWMTKHQGDVDYFDINKERFPKPRVARVCFTELKVSDSLLHADNFGPMGIGFKRLFVSNRAGSPVYYISGHGLHPIVSLGSNWYNPNGKVLNDILPEDVDERFAFFKNMSSGRCAQGYIAYDLYDESEWRIIFSEKIKRTLPERKLRYFVDPNDPHCERKYKDFYRDLGDNYKPDYFVPVDEWLSLIIYPNLQIRNAAIANPEIRSLLNELKRPNKRNILAEGIPRDEIHNFPIEVDFGALKNI